MVALLTNLSFMPFFCDRLHTPMLILRCTLVLSFLLIVAPTARGQRLVDGCDRNDDQYVRCDHTTPVCECSNTDVCYFCLEIEQRLTFTRYRLTQDEIQIPGFGGRVGYIDEETGKFRDYSYATANGVPCTDNSDCTEAITVDGNSFRSVIAVVII